MGIGFDRGGMQLNSGAPLPNLNPVPRPGQRPTASRQQHAAGLHHRHQRLQHRRPELGPGILLGLNQQNTNGFSFVQLTQHGGLPAGCTTPGMGCPLSWNSQNRSYRSRISGQTATSAPMSVLPDSGIGYMTHRLAERRPHRPTTTRPAARSGATCLPNATTVQVFLPGQTGDRRLHLHDGGDTPGSNPTQPFGVAGLAGRRQAALQPTSGAPSSRTSTYLYDPINGFVGYQALGHQRQRPAIVIPMLALQGNLALPNGFLSSFPTYLMGGLTLQQTGSGTLSGPIIGPGGLTLQSGNVTLAGRQHLCRRHDGERRHAHHRQHRLDRRQPHGQSRRHLRQQRHGEHARASWQLNQGSFTNSNAFLGNLANTGTATNTGTLTGSVINGAAGSFANNGTVTGSVANMGILPTAARSAAHRQLGVLSGTARQGSLTNRASSRRATRSAR